MNPLIAAKLVIEQTPIMPCPFCGKEGQLYMDCDDDGRVRIGKQYVRCIGCGAKGPEFSEYKYQSWECAGNAKAAWNLRIKA